MEEETAAIGTFVVLFMQKHLCTKECCRKSVWKANSSCYFKGKHQRVSHLCSASSLLPSLFSGGRNAILQQRCWADPGEANVSFSRWQTASAVMLRWKAPRGFAFVAGVEEHHFLAHLVYMLLHSWWSSQESFSSSPQVPVEVYSKCPGQLEDVPACCRELG